MGLRMPPSRHPRPRDRGLEPSSNGGTAFPFPIFPVLPTRLSKHAHHLACFASVSRLVSLACTGALFLWSSGQNSNVLTRNAHGTIGQDPTSSIRTTGGGVGRVPRGRARRKGNPSPERHSCKCGILTLSTMLTPIVSCQLTSSFSSPASSKGLGFGVPFTCL